MVATLSRFGNQLTKLIINLDHCQRYEIFMKNRLILESYLAIFYQFYWRYLSGRPWYWRRIMENLSRLVSKIRQLVRRWKQSISDTTTRLFFEHPDIDTKRKVSIDAKQQKIEDVLNNLFRGQDDLFRYQ